MPDPENHIQAVLDRVRPEHLCRHYNFVKRKDEEASGNDESFWTSVEDFLTKVNNFFKIFSTFICAGGNFLWTFAEGRRTGYGNGGTANSKRFSARQFAPLCASAWL